MDLDEYKNSNVLLATYDLCYCLRHNEWLTGMQINEIVLVTIMCSNLIPQNNYCSCLTSQSEECIVLHKNDYLEVFPSTCGTGSCITTVQEIKRSIKGRSRVQLATHGCKN